MEASMSERISKIPGIVDYMVARRKHTEVGVQE